MTTTTNANNDEHINILVTTAFREGYDSHHDRETDPGLALQSAREAVSAVIPEGRTGTFDDESLTFVVDPVDPSAEELVAAQWQAEYQEGAERERRDPRRFSSEVEAEIERQILERAY